MEISSDYQMVIVSLASIAAWIAALFAYWSYRVSKKALELSESENNAKKTNIAAYLANAFRIYDDSKNQGKYIFSIAYSNRADADDAITEIFLEIYYVNSRNRVSYLISTHEENSSDWLSGKAKAARLPLNIKARSSVTSWFVFGTLAIAEKAQRIEKYKVVARNGRGEEIALESYILREISYEKSS